MRPMNSNTARYFLTLCEEQNFTRAAKRCGISQPSLTISIRKLERLLGGQLFHRKPTSGSPPTALALAVKPHFELVIKSVEEARRIAKKQTSGHKRTRDSQLA
jgi:LysR family hydrogen peroxide-inducible transcriptional activator